MAPLPDDEDGAGGDMYNPVFSKNITPYNQVVSRHPSSRPSKHADDAPEISEGHCEDDDDDVKHADDPGHATQHLVGSGGAKTACVTRVRIGMVIRKWRIVSRIGAGSFGETFVGVELPPSLQQRADDAHRHSIASDQNDSDDGETESHTLIPEVPSAAPKEVCIKVEQESKNVLRLEVLALKKVQLCPQVVRYVASGRHMDANYLVMERLGQNLVELRRNSTRGIFSIYTMLRVGISCLKAIKGIHELGLLHRDIKPSNFVIGLSGEAARTCFLIDFGLARRFRRSNGDVRAPRDEAGFRGTSRYASLRSHQHLDLGRVDDLWSLLFMLVEFATGTLPWRKFKEKDDIGRCKQETVDASLVKNLPREFNSFLEHLQSLQYASEPKYDMLIALLQHAIERRGYPPNKQLDWEEPQQQSPEAAPSQQQAAGVSIAADAKHLAQALPVVTKVPELAVKRITSSFVPEMQTVVPRKDIQVKSPLNVDETRDAQQDVEKRADTEKAHVEASQTPPRAARDTSPQSGADPRRSLEVMEALQIHAGNPPSGRVSVARSQRGSPFLELEDSLEVRQRPVGASVAGASRDEHDKESVQGVGHSVGNSGHNQISLSEADFNRNHVGNGSAQKGGDRGDLHLDQLTMRLYTPNDHRSVGVEALSPRGVEGLDIIGSASFPLRPATYPTAAPPDHAIDDHEASPNVFSPRDDPGLVDSDYTPIAGGGPLYSGPGRRATATQSNPVPPTAGTRRYPNIDNRDTPTSPRILTAKDDTACSCSIM